MTERETYNTELAVEAEQARQARDGDMVASAIVTVKAIQPVSVAGELHGQGETFSAPEAAVEQAIARGLVEKVEAKSKK